MGLKLKGVPKSQLMNWMIVALKDAEASDLTLSDLIAELEFQKKACQSEREKVIESGRY